MGVYELGATPVVPAAKFLLRRRKVDEALAMTMEVIKLGTASAG